MASVSTGQPALDQHRGFAYPRLMPAQPHKQRTRRLGTVGAIILAAAYCAALLVRPQPSWPGPIRRAIGYSSQTLYNAVDAGLRKLGIDAASIELRSGAYLILVSALIPWVLMALMGRGAAHDLGIRRPNVIGLRSILVGYVVALPFLVWMVRGAGFGDEYMRQLRRAGAFAFILYYCVNMLTEHFLFHGVLLALFRTKRRWPAPAPVSVDSAHRFVRILQWLGLSQPGTPGRQTRHTTFGTRVRSWMGLQAGCVPAVLASGMLFGLVHVGKDPRELLLSVPGGIGLAYLAYRTNTWLIPFILHLATAGTACGALVLLQAR